MKRTRTVGTLIAAAVLAIPATATADVTKQDRAGDVDARGLKAGDRKALDIAAVDAVPHRFGLTVTTTMRGDAEGRLGEGKLQRAVLALVLFPENRKAKPKVLAVGEDDANASNLPRSTGHAAVVDGREATFVVSGVDTKSLRRLEVVSLSNGTRPGGDKPNIRRIRRDLGLKNTADLIALKVTAALLFDPAVLEELSCAELEKRREKLVKVALLLTALNQTTPSRLVELALSVVAGEVDAIDEEAESRPCRLALTAEGGLRYVDGFPGEFRLDVIFRETNARNSFRAASANPVDAVRIVVSGRQVTNFICSGPLPVGEISTTSSQNDTLTCSGGSLPLGENYFMNVQTNPPPSDGMGAQVSARQDGSFVGPFSLAGP
jgi:hypothetical protein